MLWYAVQRDREDDWGTGSYDLDTAIAMAKDWKQTYPNALVAVIDEGIDSLCIREIEV